MKHIFSSCSFVALFMALLLFGCSKKYYPSIDTSERTDSTTSHNERDTTIISPAAHTGLKIPFYSLFNAELNSSELLFNLGETSNKQARLKASVVTDGKTKQKSLNIDCDCDTLAIQAKLKDKTVTVVKEKMVTKTTVVEKRFIPFIIKFLAWVGGLSILSLILLIIYHLKFKK